jgi:uncharacterized protein
MFHRSFVHALMVVAVLGSTGMSPAEAADNPQQFRAACEEGDAPSCGILGGMYAEGTNVNQDAGQAALFYRKACDGRFMQSCYNLGVIYEKGTGLVPDAGRAAAFYRKACDGGVPQGCYNLAAMYSRGAMGLHGKLVTAGLHQAVPLSA